MELTEFVKSTISQITQGVKEAQELVQEYGGIVNPSEVYNDNFIKATVSDKQRLVQVVDFEVGLTNSNNESGKNSIGVVLGVLKGGVSTASDDQQTSVTKIKFSIPLVLPSIDNNNTPSSGFRVGSNRRTNNRY